MIKHIINIIKGWFIPKKEMDPHEEMYLKSKESDVPVYENEQDAVSNRKLEKIKRKHKGS
jgi:hypothetical protein|tara:strand:- start:232 stop:411 length:180 start_codon:yes stop_codon:yes gene_type:complete